MASFHISAVVRDSMLGQLQQSVTAVIKHVNLIISLTPASYAY